MHELKVGDQVVHPVHGPGTVTKIEERDVGSGPVRYVHLALGSLTLLLPAHEVEAAGLRAPMDAAEAERLLALLAGPTAGDDPGHTERRRRNAGGLTSGQAEELARIVHSLDALRQSTGKALREQDSAHLASARQRLADEVAIALDIDRSEALERIRRALLEGDEGP